MKKLLVLLILLMATNVMGDELTPWEYSLTSDSIVHWVTADDALLGEHWENIGFDVFVLLNSNNTECVTITATTEIAGPWGDTKAYSKTAYCTAGQNQVYFGPFNTYRFNNDTGYVNVYYDINGDTYKLNNTSVTVIRRVLE